MGELVRRRHSNSETRKKLSKHCIVELIFVVNHYGMRDVEPTCNGRPNEVGGLVLRDGGQYFCFNPFDKVIPDLSPHVRSSQLQ